MQATATSRLAPSSTSATRSISASQRGAGGIPAGASAHRLEPVEEALAPLGVEGLVDVRGRGAEGGDVGLDLLHAAGLELLEARGLVLVEELVLVVAGLDRRLLQHLLLVGRQRLEGVLPDQHRLLLGDMAGQADVL